MVAVKEVVLFSKNNSGIPNSKKEYSVWQIWHWLRTGDCTLVCGDQEPYGFVPECCCPVHDPEKWLHVKIMAFIHKNSKNTKYPFPL
jgi:hypothetical protein